MGNQLAPLALLGLAVASLPARERSTRTLAPRFDPQKKHRQAKRKQAKASRRRNRT